MKQTKKEFRIFLITDYEKEGEYLSLRHSQGWKFVKVVFPGIYYFEKCTPEDVVYQLDYNQDGLSNKDEYVQLFQDCGWEYLMDFFGYSYFRKSRAAMDGDEQIFCDEESRLEMLQRVFQGRMLPLCIILFGVFIPQLISVIGEPRNDMTIILILYSILFLIYLFVFVTFAVRYRQLKSHSKR